MGDDDELGLAGHAAQVLRIARDVDIVERGFDLVQDAERRRVDFQDREIDRDGDQRLFAARQGGQVADDLARRVDFDLDAGAEHVRLVGQIEPGAAAAEQLAEDMAEVAVDLLEALCEHRFHLAAELADHAGQLRLGALDVADLGFQEVVAFLDLLVFVDGADVDIAQRADLGADLGHLAAQVGHVGKLDTVGLRLVFGQLVFVPQLGGGRVQLVLGRGAAFGQAGHLAAHALALVGQRAVLLPEPGDLGFFLQALLVGRADGGFGGGYLLFVLAAGALDLGGLQLVPLDRRLRGGHGGVQLAAAGLGLAAAALERFKRGFVQADVLFARQALHLRVGQAGGQLFALLGQAAGRLAQRLQFGRVGGQLFFRFGAGVVGLGAGGGIAGDLLLELVKLLRAAFGRRLPFGHGGVEPFELKACAQAGGGRVDALAFGPGQLRGKVVHLGPAGLGLLFGGGAALFQRFELAAQLFQLLLAGEHPGAARRGTAREAAARVDDLAVQRDDAVAVAEVFGHGGGFGQVLDHNDAAEQVIDDVAVAFVGFDQVGGDLGRAGQAAGKAVALHGVQRQEGGAPGALLLQKCDGGAGAALVLDDDVLQSEAERGLDGRLVAFAHREDARHRADNAAQAVRRGRAHDGLDALLVAVQVAFKVFQDADALGGVAAVALGFLQRFGGFGLLAAAAFQLELEAVFDVVAAGDGLLGRAQGVRRGGALLAQLGGGPGGGPGLGVERVELRLRGLQRRGQRGGLHLERGGALLQAGHGGVDNVLPLAALQRLVFQRVHLGAQVRDVRGDRLHPRAQVRNGRAVGGGFFLQAARTLAGAGQLGLGVGDLRAGVFVFVAEHGQAAVRPRARFGQRADVGVRLLDRKHELLGFAAQRLGARVEFIQLAGQARVVALGGFVAALLVAHGVLRAADRIDPQRDLQAFARIGIFQELLRFFAVALERADAAFQLAEDVAQALEVAFGGGQAALGLVFAVAEPGDAGGFLKNFAPLARLGADDLGNAALADDGVAVAAKTCVQQQLVHVLEAHVLAVDRVFALAAAVVAAADRDFVGVHRKAVVRVVDGQADGGVAHRAAGLGAAKDDVLHLARAAQLLGAGFAHDPADGVGYIAFARTVGPDNAGDAGADRDLGAVGEGFETLDLQFF